MVPPLHVIFVLVFVFTLLLVVCHAFDVIFSLHNNNNNNSLIGTASSYLLFCSIISHEFLQLAYWYVPIWCLCVSIRCGSFQEVYQTLMKILVS